MRTRSSGCLFSFLLISNAHNTDASGLVRKFSAISQTDTVVADVGGTNINNPSQPASFGSTERVIVLMRN